MTGEQIFGIIVGIIFLLCTIIFIVVMVTSHIRTMKSYDRLIELHEKQYKEMERILSKKDWVKIRERKEQSKACNYKITSLFTGWYLFKSTPTIFAFHPLGKGIFGKFADIFWALI